MVIELKVTLILFSPYQRIKCSCKQTRDKTNKVLMTICLDKELLKQFKRVAQKDMHTQISWVSCR